MTTTWRPLALAALVSLPASADVGAATAALKEAQDEYVHGNYGNARSKARQALTLDGDLTTSQRAWRLIGASSCFLGDRSAVDQAMDNLASATDHAFLRYVCGSKGLPLDGKKTAAATAVTSTGSGPAAETGDGPPPSPRERDALLAEAQKAYAGGDYAGAIDKARRAGNVARAWRILGASHCALKNRDGAVEVWNRMAGADRNFVKYVCARNNITIP